MKTTGNISYAKRSEFLYLIDHDFLNCKHDWSIHIFYCDRCPCTNYFMYSLVMMVGPALFLLGLGFMTSGGFWQSIRKTSRLRHSLERCNYRMKSLTRLFQPFFSSYGVHYYRLNERRPLRVFEFRLAQCIVLQQYSRQGRLTTSKRERLFMW